MKRVSDSNDVQSTSHLPGGSLKRKMTCEGLMALVAHVSSGS